MSAEGSSAPRGVRTMAVLRWALVALAAAAALFSFATVVRHRDPSAVTTTLYHCPMHPSVIQDHPGECPICGMTLVPQEKAVSSPPPVAGLVPIELTPERIQLIGMRTARVARQVKGGELRVVGVVAPSERGLSQVTTRFAGWIEALAVSETGRRVRRGEVLATFYSPEVLKAQEELLVARRWQESGTADPATRRLGEAARERLSLLGIAGHEIDEVLRSGHPSVAIPLRAPRDGYVMTRNAVAGLAVQPGTVLFEVADLGTVWVNAEVPEPDLARVSVGQAARLTLASLPGETFAGRVQLLAPALDQNRTLRVRVELRNRFDASGPRLRPGMSGTVALTLPAASGLMVPAEAVVDTGEAKYVFVAREGGRFEPRIVEPGPRQGDQVEIVKGLAEGETVVTTGNFLIDSESRLRAALAR
jgi:Cu(I)/Ag(I) efflux system membrane fusion protein